MGRCGGCDEEDKERRPFFLNFEDCLSVAHMEAPAVEKLSMAPRLQVHDTRVLQSRAQKQCLFYQRSSGKFGCAGTVGGSFLGKRRKTSALTQQKIEREGQRDGGRQVL